MTQENVSEMPYRWYVVQTTSGSEEKIQKKIQERIRAEALEDDFKGIVVPMEEVLEMHGGARRRTRRCFYPGYVLIHMRMHTPTWHLVRNTPGVFGFIGGESGLPAALSEQEIERILRRIDDSHERPVPKVSFEPGEVVRIIEGPFSDFDATVDQVNHGKSSLWVNVMVFGRPTPMEVSFKQVIKI